MPRPSRLSSILHHTQARANPLAFARQYAQSSQQRPPSPPSTSTPTSTPIPPDTPGKTPSKPKPRLTRRPTTTNNSFPLSLDHFLLRQRTLSLYRTILRTCHHFPDRTAQHEWRAYAREEFDRQGEVTDVRRIRYLLSVGKSELERLGKQVVGRGVGPW